MDDQRSHQMTGDELLKRQIENALAVEPSPEFMARVRARVDREPAPKTWFLWWTPAAAGVFAATIAAAIIVTSIDRDTASVASDTGVAATVSNSVPPVRKEPAPVRDTGVTASTLRPLVVAVTRTTPKSARPVVSARSRERKALRLLITNMREGRIDPTALDDLDAPELVSVREIPMEPIAIEPVPQITLLNMEPLPQPAALGGQPSW